MKRRSVGALVGSGVMLAGLIVGAPGALAIGLGGLPSGAIIQGQGLGMPKSGHCADLAGTAEDKALSWGTGLSGHWVKGWDTWGGPDGRGGDVCVRAMAVYGGQWFFVGSGEGESPAPPLVVEERDR